MEGSGSLAVYAILFFKNQAIDMNDKFQHNQIKMDQLVTMWMGLNYFTFYARNAEGNITMQYAISTYTPCFLSLTVKMNSGMASWAFYKVWFLHHWENMTWFWLKLHPGYSDPWPWLAVGTAHLRVTHCEVLCWVIPFWRITSTASLIIVCFCPGEFQYNPSTTGIYYFSQFIPQIDWTNANFWPTVRVSTAFNAVPYYHTSGSSFPLNIVKKSKY